VIYLGDLDLAGGQIEDNTPQRSRTLGGGRTALGAARADRTASDRA
jgi:hypothetical protein